MHKFIKFLMCIVLLASMTTSPQGAEAKVTCSSAQNAVISSALSSGNIALASRAKNMCSNPCESIINFYRANILNSKDSATVMDAYNTCRSSGTGTSPGGSGNNGSGELGKCKNTAKIKMLVPPKISGTPKNGKTLSLIPGKFSGCATTKNIQDPITWYKCLEFHKKGAIYVRLYNDWYEDRECMWNSDSRGVNYGRKVKLGSEHVDWYMTVCMTVANKKYYGVFCSASTKKVRDFQSTK